MTDLKNQKQFSASIDQVPLVKEFIETRLKKLKVDEPASRDIILAADEAVTNIILHAYRNRESRVGDEITVNIETDKNEIRIIFTDRGSSFDINKAPPPDINLNLAGKRRGGFGLFLMKSLMDKIKYRPEKNCNITTLIKKIT